MARVKQGSDRGSRSLRRALEARFAPQSDGSFREYSGWVHRSNPTAIGELRRLIEDPSDRRYYYLPPGVDHTISAATFAAVTGTSVTPERPGGHWAEYREL